MLTQKRPFLYEDWEGAWCSRLALAWAPTEDPQIQKTCSAPSGNFVTQAKGQKEGTGSWGSSQGRWEVRGQCNIYPDQGGLSLSRSRKALQSSNIPSGHCLPVCPPAFVGRWIVSPIPSSFPEPSSLSPLEGVALCPASCSERVKDLPIVASSYNHLPPRQCSEPGLISLLYSESESSPLWMWGALGLQLLIRSPHSNTRVGSRK